MSSTRKAVEGTPLRQERYASDPVFNDHLKASAVSRKCRLLTNPVHREMALHLQYVSMQPGGLAAFAADLLKRYGNRIGSDTMRQHAGQKFFNAALVQQTRRELECHLGRFPLKDEWTPSPWEGPEQDEYELADEYEARLDAWRSEKKRKAAKHPSSYPVTDFIEYCMDRAESSLEEWLAGFCLDPNITLDTPPLWFQELEQSLVHYFADRRLDHQAAKIVTSIGEQINDALEYAWEERVLVHINGMARTGKTYQLREWCAAYPGRARYVEIPPGHDDISFFRAIARALGTACGSTMKTTQIKRQIEDAIQDSGIMLVFDEAHNAFPQRHDIRTAPKRILWIMSALVNKGVPAVLVSTEQFDTYLKSVVKTTGWASEQLDGRIAFRQDLPATLPDEDLVAIAQHYFPESPKDVSSILCWYACRSGKYIAGLEAVAKRARYLARKVGRDMPNGADLKTAMIQVDPAIAQIFEKDTAAGTAETGKPDLSAQPKQKVCKPSAKRVQQPIRRTEKAIRPTAKQLEKVH